MKAWARASAVLFSFVVGTAHAHGPAPDTTPQPRAVAAASANSKARSLTLSLLDAANQYNNAAPGAKGQLLANLLATAKERHDELVLNAQADPAEFMRVILPPELLAGLPSQAMAFLEQSADVTGTLDVFHVDHVDSADDYYEHVLTTTNDTYRVHFAKAAPDLPSGTRIRVRGIRLDKHIVVTAAGDITIAKASVLGNTLGAQKTLVILVNFSDAPTAQPYTVAQAQNVVFTTTSNYDYEASYQQTTLTGAVAGWYTIANPSTNCDYNTIASQAKQRATAAGYVLSNYNRYVYVFPANTCTWWGLGSVGGNPSQAWIHTKWGLSLGVVGHEMGHNFGLWHSHSLDCGTAAVAASGCTTSEYGDVFDIMGNSGTGHFNAYHKERLGWLNSGISPPLITVPLQTGPTTYSFAPLENPRDSVPRALKIPRGTSCTASNEHFYVEARRGVTGGVVIHRVTDGTVDSSYLLDMTPATSAWTDAALPWGQAFYDAASGVTITPAGTALAPRVSVSYQGAASCTRVAPTMTHSPTGTVWTSAGASVTYAVSVTNKDSCGCGAAAFDATATGMPAGWSSTNAHTASIAPGSTTNTSVVVTTTGATAPNFYPITLQAANSSASTMKASAPATVAVSTAVAVTPTTDRAIYVLPKQKNATINVAIATKVTSSGTAVPGASVSVQVREPGGKLSTLSGTTASDGIARVTYSMRPRTSSTGTYNVTSTATIGSITASSGTTFAVSN